MKKISLLIISFLLVFSFSCSKDKISEEPNDTIEEANPVSPGTEFKMSINPEGDVDWYEVEVPGQGYLEVRAREVPEELDLHARFATYDEWNSNGEEYITGQLRLPAAVQIVEEGTYYVRLGDRYNNNYSPDEFKVKMNFIEEFDKHEPNNKPPEASEVEFGKEYKSAIFPLNDRDWFLTVVEQQGYLRIRAKDIPDDIELAAYVATYDEYAADKKNTVKSNTRVPFDVAITEPGEYYVVFRDRYDNYSSKDKFTWRIDFLPEMDKYEPNDDFSQAEEIELNSSVELAIFPEGDRDFFKVVPERTGTLYLKARDYGDIDLTARLFKPDLEDESKVITLEGKTRFPAEFDLTNSGGEYYVELMDRYDNNSNPELFKVLFEFE